jgi:hypothetical protein
MKKSILLYVAITAILLNIFTYMYFKQQKAQDDLLYKNLEKKYAETVSKIDDAAYFSLENNQKAQDYFNNDTTNPINYEQLIPAVTNKLLSFNDDKKGNKYVGHDQLGEMKFIINKVKILNHRWIIADFNDGQLWGEVLLKYFVAPNGDISFEVIQSVLYSN